MSSLRFTRASSEFASRANSPRFPANAAYTAIFWLYPVSNPSDYQSLLTFSYDVNDGPTIQDSVGILNDMKLFAKVDNGSGSPSYTQESATGALSTGGWYKIALVRESATSFKAYYAAAGAALAQFGATITRDVSGRSALVGDSTYFGRFRAWYPDIRLAGLRLWTTNLTTGELATEFTSATAVKTASLWSAFSTDDSSVANLLNDQTANNYDLTDGTGGLSLEDSPTLEGGSTYTPRRTLLGVG